MMQEMMGGRGDIQQWMGVLRHMIDQEVDRRVAEQMRSDDGMVCKKWVRAGEEWGDWEKEGRRGRDSDDRRGRRSDSDERRGRKDSDSDDRRGDRQWQEE